MDKRACAKRGVEMWKNWFGAKDEKRAVEGGGDRWPKLESRVEDIEARLVDLHRKFDSVAELPVQWATTTTQLRRLVGHITKTQGLDALKPPAPSGPTIVRPMTQDDVIQLVHKEAVR
jgi:hypothetical protein